LPGTVSRGRLPTGWYPARQGGQMVRRQLMVGDVVQVDGNIARRAREAQVIRVYHADRRAAVSYPDGKVDDCIPWYRLSVLR